MVTKYPLSLDVPMFFQHIKWHSPVSWEVTAWTEPSNVTPIWEAMLATFDCRADNFSKISSCRLLRAFTEGTPYWSPPASPLNLVIELHYLCVYSLLLINYHINITIITKNMNHISPQRYILMKIFINQINQLISYQLPFLVTWLNMGITSSNYKYSVIKKKKKTFNRSCRDATQFSNWYSDICQLP